MFLKPKKHVENISQAWNVFMWITLIIGNGLLMCLYSQEWFAHRNCPSTSVSSQKLLNLKLFFCLFLYTVAYDGHSGEVINLRYHRAECHDIPETF